MKHGPLNRQFWMLICFNSLHYMSISLKFELRIFRNKTFSPRYIEFKRFYSTMCMYKHVVRIIMRPFIINQSNYKFAA